MMNLVRAEIQGYRYRHDKSAPKAAALMITGGRQWCQGIPGNETMHTVPPEGLPWPETSPEP